MPSHSSAALLTCVSSHVLSGVDKEVEQLHLSGLCSKLLGYINHFCLIFSKREQDSLRVWNALGSGLRHVRVESQVEQHYVMHPDGSM
jgi:hypothetical protein